MLMAACGSTGTPQDGRYQTHDGGRSNFRAEALTIPSLPCLHDRSQAQHPKTRAISSDAASEIVALFATPLVLLDVRTRRP